MTTTPLLRDPRLNACSTFICTGVCTFGVVLFFLLAAHKGPQYIESDATDTDDTVEVRQFRARLITIRTRKLPRRATWAPQMVAHSVMHIA
jgi:hypothetical protein